MTQQEDLTRIRARVMRGHAFTGEGRYCQGMLGPRISGSAEHGFVAMSVGCGWPRDMHPEAVGR